MRLFILGGAARCTTAACAPWPGVAGGLSFRMHLLLAALAVLFVILGFVGFGLGGLPTILFWGLAALCVIAAWKSRPISQRVREDRKMSESSVPPRSDHS